MAEREDDNFLARWSRRKRDIAREEEAGNLAPTSDEATLRQQAEAEAAELEANRLAAEAVDIETLEYESDFGIFLKRGVPDLLRKQALRKLWTSSPVLANLDGLNDYEADFGDPKLNTFTSIWQVGRGFMGLEDEEGKKPSKLPEPEGNIAERAAPTTAEQTVATVPVSSEPALSAAADEGDAETNESEETSPPEQAVERPRISIRKRLMT